MSEMERSSQTHCQKSLIDKLLWFYYHGNGGYIVLGIYNFLTFVDSLLSG